jgi:hypothetical protein
MKKNMNMVMLAGAIVVLSTVVANAVMMTLFTGWSGLIERKSPDIIVARCLKTPDPDYDEAADSWELSYFDMTNFASFATNLADKSNPVSAYLLEAISHQKLKFFSPSELTTGTNADNMLWASVMENLNEVIYGPSIYESNRFRTVRLRPETGELLKKHPQEPELAQLNRMLLEDAYLREIVTKHFKTGLLRSQHTSPVFESDIEVLSVLKGATKLGVSRHGKFLERCKWLNGSGLVDKAGHCAQSFSRLGHVKTISKRAIEDGALVGRSTSPSAGQSPGQGARPSASGPASLFGRCSRGGRATLVCSD